MTEILITRVETVVTRVSYDRRQACEILTDHGDVDPAELAKLTTRQIAEKLVQYANDDAGGVGDTIAQDAGDPEETIDVGDWEVTEVRGDPGPSPMERMRECHFGGHDYRGDLCHRCGTTRQS